MTAEQRLKRLTREHKQQLIHIFEANLRVAVGPIFMRDQSVFHLISELTQKEGISCLLIGGFAVNYYKVTRQTADLEALK